ncbi:hypothetical protein Hamer_G003309 [Homarus americanus]|uniref:Uncharacterized protein n=2 Tax=Homarus americanus TaxID=6706 RepID=A0A8J5N728_HOMAM|nr:hypothetical protein Hamer_G003309 [Homarus americanus]
MDSAGQCRLHQLLTEPDGASDTICYKPVYPATPPPPPSTTADPAAVTTTLSASPTSMADISNTHTANVKTKAMCNANAGALGIYQDSTSFFLICKNHPNELPFNINQPTDECVNTGDYMQCMSVTCTGNNIINGFRQATFPVEGPCSSNFIASITSLDLTDCHTVSGAMQTQPANSDGWTQWRICPGDTTSFYVMTGVQVTDLGSGEWSLDSITCCLIRRLV